MASGEFRSVSSFNPLTTDISPTPGEVVATTLGFDDSFHLDVSGDGSSDRSEVVLSHHTGNENDCQYRTEFRIKYDQRSQKPYVRTEWRREITSEGPGPIRACEARPLAGDRDFVVYDGETLRKPASIGGSVLARSTQDKSPSLPEAGDFFGMSVDFVAAALLGTAQPPGISTSDVRQLRNHIDDADRKTLTKGDRIQWIDRHGDTQTGVVVRFGVGPFHLEDIGFPAGFKAYSDPPGLYIRESENGESEEIYLPPDTLVREVPKDPDDTLRLDMSNIGF